MEYVQNLLILGGLYSLLALSGYVVTVTGQVSLGQQGFYAIGAYLAGIGTALWGWSLLPALLFGALVAAAVGAVVGVPALRIRGLYLAVATLAFGEMVRLSLLSVDYNRVIEGKRVGPVGAEGFRHIRWFPDHGWTSLAVMGLILVITLLVVVALALVDRSRIGARMRAVGHDEMAAAMVGVDVSLVKVGAFVAGAALAGLAGGLYAHQATFVSHEQFTLELGMFVAAYVLIGGSGNVLGPLFGVAFFMTLIEGLRFMGWLRYVLFGAAIVVCMTLRPNGLVDDRVARYLNHSLARSLRPVLLRVLRRSPVAAS
jgi:branched-chain amino acid transport system permease protein